MPIKENNMHTKLKQNKVIAKGTCFLTKKTSMHSINSKSSMFWTNNKPENVLSNENKAGIASVLKKAKGKRFRISTKEGRIFSIAKALVEGAMAYSNV